MVWQRLPLHNGGIFEFLPLVRPVYIGIGDKVSRKMGQREPQARPRFAPKDHLTTCQHRLQHILVEWSGVSNMDLDIIPLYRVSILIRTQGGFRNLAIATLIGYRHSDSVYGGGTVSWSSHFRETSPSMD